MRERKPLARTQIHTICDQKKLCIQLAIFLHASSSHSQLASVASQTRTVDQPGLYKEAAEDQPLLPFTLTATHSDPQTVLARLGPF